MIWGWILVGSQFRDCSIDDAIEAEPATKALSLSSAPGQAPDQRIYSQSKHQQGLVVVEDGFGLTPKPSRQSPLSVEPEEENQFFSYRGDERKRGPIYNYARIFTYCHLINTTNRCLAVMMNNIYERKTCSREGEWTGANFDEQLKGSAACTEVYCGLDQHEIYAYPEWHETGHHIQKGIIVAILVALMVQWGTTGPAIMIAYLTPSRGLGCRSAGYLLYGVFSTLIMLFLILSMLCSHEAMLQIQRAYQKPDPIVAGEEDAHEMNPLNPQAANNNNEANSPQLPAIQIQGAGQENDPIVDAEEDVHEVDPRVAQATNNEANLMIAQAANNNNNNNNNNNKDNEASSPQLPSTVSFWLFSRVAVILRCTGKLLAVFNGLWIIFISVAEYVGGFDNCWCYSDTPGQGDQGWVVLFKSAHALSQSASTPWSMGVLLIVLICALSLAFFYIGTKETELRSE